MTIRALMLIPAAAATLLAQVSSDRLLHTDREPQNWLTYSGGYSSQRYSLLDQINPQNARNLELKWVFQAHSLEKFEATPLVVDGVMYFTEAPDHVFAVDAKTGRIFWDYEYRPLPEARVCCGSVNRGLAILGDTLFMGTIDGRLIALDAKSGRPVWNVEVGDPKLGYAITHAPLVVKDKVIVGVAGGEYGIRGFIAAYDAHTGKEAWRFYTIPGKGDPGNETWKGDSWQHGGASVWVTGSYDPALNLTYWGIGNPGPDWNGDERDGDNLYSDCVVALDPDTGKLKWYFQFTPHDTLDYDSVQVPVLADMQWQGQQVYPGVQGATNWYSPSYSPRTGLFYIPAWDKYSSVFVKVPTDYTEGRRYVGTSPRSVVGLQGAAVNQRKEDEGYGAVRAIDPKTGEQKWEFKMLDVTDAGILTTASDLLFSGGREGYFYALDGRSGELLWKANVGGAVSSGPISYSVNGRQYIAVSAGNSLLVYALKQ